MASRVGFPLLQTRTNDMTLQVIKRPFHGVSPTYRRPRRASSSTLSDGYSLDPDDPIA